MFDRMKDKGVALDLEGALRTVQERNVALQARFADKLKVNHQLNRQLVSFQANKSRPFYRWFRYKESFSEPLVQYLLDILDLPSGHILDPFAGVGTTLFAASERGLDATGIELLPVGCEVIEVRRQVQSDNVLALRSAVDRWRRERPWKQIQSGRPFAHLSITRQAFPEETQLALERYLAALEQETESVARLLRFAAMCVLEDISYTRKDGQYLRWDHRSGRQPSRKPFQKGHIATFDEAIVRKLDEIYADLQPQSLLPGFLASRQQGKIEILRGSCLNLLPAFEAASFDGLITSPPYVNRYDYTRTYALELAFLGVDDSEIRDLRQAMVSCTVENRTKSDLASVFSPSTLERATAALAGQSALQTILNYLEWQKEAQTLNNAGIPRMVHNYFYELALLIFESARVLKPGAAFVMVNDNVRYAGATIPVDLILSDFAEQAGFSVEVIWVLPTSKGNSSQQMGTHGREVLRKCIYLWRRRSD